MVRRGYKIPHKTSRTLKLKILVITLLYLPDGGPSAPLYSMLCEELARKGHQVTVVTAVPHYPSGRVDPGYRGGWIQRSRENGVKVIRIRVPSIDRSNLRKRLLQFVIYQIGATWASVAEEYDVLLVGNPAIETCLPLAVLHALHHKPIIFSVHDVYPDVGISLGIFTNKFVIRLIAALERFCLNRSSYVRILSKSFITGLRALGVSDNKMKLVYDWVDTELIKPLPRDNPFSLENNLSGFFVVLYAGNIGFSQGLEHVLTVAESMAQLRDIQFLFVGDGAGRSNLESEALKRGLQNVRFLPFQPRSRLPEVLATGDVLLVTLKKGLAFGSLPSKTFSIFASGRPIIASVDEGSELQELIQRAGAGICVPPENPEELASAILQLRNEPTLRRRLGDKGRRFAARYHSPKAAAEQIEKIMIEAIAREKPNHDSL